MREGADRRAVGDRDARPEHHIRLDGDVLAEFGVGRQKYGVRRDHGDAGIEGCGAQALLQHGLGFGELRLGVDPAHVVLSGFDRDRLQAHIAGNGNRITEIVFAFGIGIADAIENGERLVAGKRHQTAIAQTDLAFRLIGIAVLADRQQFIAARQQPPVARRIRRTESQHRHRRTAGKRRAQLRERFRPHQRRVGEHHQNIVGQPSIRFARNRLARRQHRVRRAAPFLLHEYFGFGRKCMRLLRHIIVVGPDHDGDFAAAGLHRRGQHMREQRASADRVQRLRQGGAHAGALAGGQHDRKAASLSHRLSDSRVATIAAHPICGRI